MPMRSSENRIPRLVGYNYSADEYMSYVQSDRLLTLRIDTNLNCNLNCLYCAWDSHSKRSETIEIGLVLDAVCQAKELGAKSIIIIGGGEPTLYPSVNELISSVHEMGLVPVMITNGTNLDDESIRFLDDEGCSLSLKLDSFDPETQDVLVGRTGSHERQKRSLDRALAIFGPQDCLRPRLALSFVITKLNIDESEALWRFCRENNIIPNPNIFNPRGRGRLHEARLRPDAADLERVLARFAEIDDQEFGVVSEGISEGEPTCLQHLYSVYMDVSGNVSPCPAVRCADFNVREHTLASIIKSDYFQQVRSTPRHLTESSGVAMISH